MIWMTTPLMALSAALTAVSANDPPAATQTVSVPFTIDQIFGARPVVQAIVNGKSYPLVVHANAGSYLQINHAEAAEAGAHDLKHVGAYGISAPGKVSDLGRDDGLVDHLAIGAWSVAAAPVSVFEVPAGGSKGMLGLPFLRASRAILDFGTKTLILPGADQSPANAAEMAQRGYSAHPMSRDPIDGRYLVAVTINGVTAPMVVSTVANVDLDTAFARRAGIATGAQSGAYGGPSGATGNVYETASPLSMHIGNWVSHPAKVTLEDTYAYSKKERPIDPTQARGGALGADFMMAYAAVIDFGSSTLYLKDG